MKYFWLLPNFAYGYHFNFGAQQLVKSNLSDPPSVAKSEAIFWRKRGKCEIFCMTFVWRLVFCAAYTYLIFVG